MLRETFTDTNHYLETGPLTYEDAEPRLDDVQTTVARLLASANGYLQRDRVAAKQCIDRAAALLLESLEPRRSPEAREVTPGLVRGGLAPWQISRLKGYVAANLDSAVALEDLAQLCRLSASHFARAFKTSFGEPPHSYVVRQRIERAKRMMLSTDKPLSQIALACGFADQSHFSRLFRRSEGASPNVWRRTHIAAPSVGGEGVPAGFGPEPTMVHRSA